MNVKTLAPYINPGKSSSDPSWSFLFPQRKINRPDSSIVGRQKQRGTASIRPRNKKLNAAGRAHASSDIRPGLEKRRARGVGKKYPTRRHYAVALASHLTTPVPARCTPPSILSLYSTLYLRATRLLECLGHILAGALALISFFSDATAAGLTSLSSSP